MRHKTIEIGLPPFVRRRRKTRFIQSALALMGCISIAGCDPVPKSGGGIPVISSSAILSSQTETLSPDQVRSVMDTSPNGRLHPRLERRYRPDGLPASGIDRSSHQARRATMSGGALITSDGTSSITADRKSIHLGGLTLGAGAADWSLAAYSALSGKSQSGHSRWRRRKV